MKTSLSVILLVLLLQGLPAGAHEINLEAFAQAIGKPIIHEGKTNLIVEISRERWEQVNLVRRFNDRKRVAFNEINLKPWVNREYLDDCLRLVEAEIIDAAGKASQELIFYGWVLGIKALKKSGWTVDKLRNPDRELRWRLYTSVEAKQKILGSPNPLPTDGREPLPTRNKNKGEGG